jgi:hypothetical protein
MHNRPTIRHLVRLPMIRQLMLLQLLHPRSLSLHLCPLNLLQRELLSFGPRLRGIDIDIRLQIDIPITAPVPVLLRWRWWTIFENFSHAVAES